MRTELIFHPLQPIIELWRIPLHYISCIIARAPQMHTISTLHERYRVCKSEPFQSEFLFHLKDIKHTAAIRSTYAASLE